MIRVGFFAIVSYRWSARDLFEESHHASDPPLRDRDRNSRRRRSGCCTNARKSHVD